MCQVDFNRFYTTIDTLKGFLDDEYYSSSLDPGIVVVVGLLLSRPVTSSLLGGNSTKTFKSDI